MHLCKNVVFVLFMLYWTKPYFTLDLVQTGLSKNEPWTCKKSGFLPKKTQILYSKPHVRSILDSTWRACSGKIIKRCIICIGSSKGTMKLIFLKVFACQPVKEKCSNVEPHVQNDQNEHAVQHLNMLNMRFNI